MTRPVRLIVAVVAALISSVIMVSVVESNCDLKTGAGCSVGLAGGDSRADLFCSPVKVGPNITLVCTPRVPVEDYEVRQPGPDRIFWKPATDAWWKD